MTPDIVEAVALAMMDARGVDQADRTEGCWVVFRRDARAALSAIAAAGCVIVPREPTEAMVEAWAVAVPPKSPVAWTDADCARADWSAMIAAARPVPAGERGSDG